ncbi:MAG: SDR family oxidoreductase [Planctomycetes bacterium]|nr:SDR family oxidoreductase [Planctomycetota bacterium]
MSLKNKVALVTGAGRGIGRASAIGLGKQGACVAISARSQNELEELAAAINAGEGNALVLVDDLTDRAAPARILDTIAEKWGPVEILVNNAGVGSSQNPKPLVDFDDDFWDLTFAVNVTAPYRFTKLALPSMIERGWGRIVNVASIAAKLTALDAAAYTASKHAIVGLTKATAKEVAAKGITANAVCPGVTRSLMNDKRIEYDAQRLGISFEDVEKQSTPLGRRLDPEEIASLVVYLAQEESGGINGQAINVCGGTIMM